MFMRLLILSFLFHANGALAQASPKDASNRNQVVITITDVAKQSPGPLLVYLYNTEETWLKTDKAKRQTVIKSRGLTEYRWTLEDLPAGVYALQVVHDEDSDGALTMGLFGPSEGVGVSQYVPTFIPRFNKASFKHQGQLTTISVKMRY